MIHYVPWYYTTNLILKPWLMTEISNLNGKHALITGASAGLGLHFAHVLARAGAHVTLAARRADKLDDAVEDIRRRGGQAGAIVMDVRDHESVSSAFQEAEKRAGVVQILINNAGVAFTKSALETQDADWDFVVDTNLKGAWTVANEAARRMVHHGVSGSMVNISSILGLRVAGALAPYAISKAGVIQMTKALALELARYSIRVNAIAPGYFETDLNREFFSTEAGQAVIKRIPQRRLGQMNELDGPLLLLASSASAYMTGTVIEVDGGHLVSSL